MKQLSIFLLTFVFLATGVNAQTTGNALEKNKAFTGAKATQKMYHAIYQMDNNDSKIIEKAFRNINNALNDPRLAGKIQIELIAFGGGTDAYMKGSKYEEDLKALIEKGVIVSQCNNTLKERKINPNQLYDFIAIVPSGNGELIIRQAEGWAVIKP
jgi:intracellular sulfur oxidation DsrE/DsrF family protein